MFIGKIASFDLHFNKIAAVKVDVAKKQIQQNWSILLVLNEIVNAQSQRRTPFRKYVFIVIYLE